MTKPSPYREELFQWIWQNLEFNCSQLQTVCGKALKIADTGEWNHGAGPDFLGAHLQIDEQDWFGSVEIHKKTGEWVQHEHHLDKNFNSVVLHVVYEDDQNCEIITQDGHKPFTLVLKPHINKKMYRLLEAKQQRGIACSGNISFINQEAFEKQVEIAHREYLEYKVEELLEFYDPSLPLSKAWKQSLIIGMYKTLGIPANKSHMVKFAQKILSDDISESGSQFVKKAERLAFEHKGDIPWVHSGMRPASRPEPRVKQAAALHWTVNQIPFQNFFKQDPYRTWNQLLKNIDSTFIPGKSRLNLIKQIVLLPALYLLGDLLHSPKLKQQVLEAWKSPAQHVPGEVKKPFTKAGFQLKKATNRVGLAHHYKRYCMEKNCYRCEVFKKAIRS